MKWEIWCGDVFGCRVPQFISINKSFNRIFRCFLFSHLVLFQKRKEVKLRQSSVYVNKILFFPTLGSFIIACPCQDGLTKRDCCQRESVFSTQAHAHQWKNSKKAWKHGNEIAQKLCDKMMAPMFWKIFIASGNRRSSRIRFTLSYPNNERCVCVRASVPARGAERWQWTMRDGSAWRCVLDVFCYGACCWSRAAAPPCGCVCEYEMVTNTEIIQFSNGLCDFSTQTQTE